MDTKIKTLIIGILFLLIPGVAFAKHKHLEKYYQKKWCTEHKGKTEVTLPDGTRADCVTDTHVIEFKFGKDWDAAIGKSLNYAMQYTPDENRKAGIVLIIEDARSFRYWIRLNSVINHYRLPIEAWIIE